jgi:hypothetical protein
MRREVTNMKINIGVFRRSAQPVVLPTLPILLVVALALVILPVAGLVAPSAAHAFNGYLEDCDFDGRDDETGVAVPWPGFDETRGDVVPANWDRVNGVEINPPDPAPSQNSGSSPSSSTNANGTVSPAAPQTDGGQSADADTAPDVGGVAAQGSSIVPTEADSAIAAVVNKKGSLTDTSSEEDSAIRPGSTITLKGSGFAGSAKGLTIELNSSSLLLGTVDSLDDGSFESSFTVPDELEVGRHNLVVSYQGYPIIQKSITVSEAAALLDTAGSVAEAPAAGGVPIGVGIAIIAVLAVAAAALLVIWKLKKGRITAQTDQQRESQFVRE